MAGASAHSTISGTAADSAAGRIRRTSARLPAAINGLAIISFRNTVSLGEPARSAVAAAVSHSSIRALVIPSRTSVTVIACTIS